MSVNNAPASCINANVEDCRVHVLLLAYKVFLRFEGLGVAVDSFYSYCHFAPFALFLSCALPAILYDVRRHVIVCLCGTV